MPIDPSYLGAIKGFEGFAPQAAWDYKQHSNGYGTGALYPGEQIDQATAEQRFQEEIGKAEAHVDSIAPNAPPGAKAALVSLTFNAGPGWSNSGLGELVKAGDWQGAAQRLQEYNKAGGEVNPGLAKRRAAEAKWFNTQPTLGSSPGQSPQMPVQGPSVPPMLGYGGSPNNAPAGYSGAQPSQGYSPGQPPEQAMMTLPPMIGLPRKPPDFRRLMAMIQKARSQPRGYG